MLIDGGSAGTGTLQYLRSKGVDHLDLMLATHPHEDHIGGLTEVLQSIPVAKVITNGQPTTTRTYERFLDAIAAAKSEYQEVRRGDTLTLGSLQIGVLNPTSSSGNNLNNQSVVLRLVHGNTTFLFEGDAEREAEASMVGSASPLDATILKVGHHGSRTASSAPFLSKVRPQVAVYSAGMGNSYGHPHPETIAALGSIGAQVYGTDTSGTVVVTSDGSSYSISTSKSAGPRAPPSSGSAPAAVSPPSAPVQPVPTVAPTSTAGLSLEIPSVTSPVRPGATATLRAVTAPGANCSIVVYYKSGPSTAAGLGPKTADASGNVSWSWTVGTRTTPGTWRIVVKTSQGGSTITKETSFTVG